MIKHFTTTDLCLATTLSLWFPIENLDKVAGTQKVMFIFKDSEDLQKLLNDYWHGQIRIEPRHYFDNLKSLKARLYGGK